MKKIIGILLAVCFVVGCSNPFFPEKKVKNRGSTPVTQEQLEELIEEAKDALEDVTVKEDGSDVDPDDWWVTQEEWDALENAIKKAEDAIDDGETNFDDIYDKLQDALKDFEDAMKPGTKVIYSVIFDTRAPAVNNPQSITVIFGQTYGTLPSLEPPTDASVTATFNGWWTEATGGTVVNADTEVTITENQTLYAQWTITSQTYTLGAKGPGTGIIFYVADGQDGRPLGFTVEGNGSPSEVVGIDVGFDEYIAYYLEAAPQNSTNSVWGDYDTFIGNGLTTFTTWPPENNPLGSKIGNGRKDTQIIIAHMDGKTDSEGKPTPISNTAAQRATQAQGDKEDWFLPSTGELYLLFLNKDKLDGMTEDGIDGMSTSWFWSSSQYGSNGAWVQYFGDGSRYDSSKSTDSYSVRAVRAFNY